MSPLLLSSSAFDGRGKVDSDGNVEVPVPVLCLRQREGTGTNSTLRKRSVEINSASARDIGLHEWEFYSLPKIFESASWRITRPFRRRLSSESRKQ